MPSACNNFFKFNLQILCHFLITTDIASSKKTWNLEIAVENANVCGKNMRYAHLFKNAAIA